jgi:hypothetical protein
LLRPVSKKLALLAPAFASMITPATLLPAFIGESSVCLWLLVKGVSVQRWKERASAAWASFWN